MRNFGVLTAQTFVAIALLAGMADAAAETFSYELYALEPGGRRLMSSGKKEYTAKDAIVRESSPNQPGVLDKELHLGNGFAVGLSDHSETRVTGLGFWIRRAPSPMEVSPYKGFSWEWFDQSKASVFEKRKGSGRIAVGTKSIGGRELVERVDFLDDSVFQLNATPNGKPGNTRMR